MVDQETPDNNELLEPHSHLVSHGQLFCLFKDPIAKQKLLITQRILTEGKVRVYSEILRWESQYTVILLLRFTEGHIHDKNH